jgi:hypothetical protein
MAKKSTSKTQGTTAKVKTPKLHQRTRFTSTSGQTLTIQLREGRRGGFNVSAALRRAKGEKVQTGARSAYVKFDDAVAQFTKLVDDAKTQGWKELARSISGAGAFASVPAAE